MTSVPAGAAGVDPLSVLSRFRIEFYACLYAAFWIALPWLIVLVAWAQGLFPPPPLPVLIGLTCLILSFAATTILTAATARTHGYRLMTGR